MEANKRKTQSSKTSDDTLLLSEGTFIRACRICLDVNTKLHCLQSIDVVDYYAALNLPPVCNSDGLPQFICIYCRHLLMKAVKFRRKCIATMNFLRTQLSLGSITTDYFENLNRADFKLPYEKSDTETFDGPENLNLTISDIKKEERLKINDGIVNSHSGLDDDLAVKGYVDLSDEQKELYCKEINLTEELNCDMNSSKEPEYNEFNLSEVLNCNEITLNTVQNFNGMNSNLEHNETENSNDVNVNKEHYFIDVEVKIEDNVSAMSQSDEDSVDVVDTHNSIEEIDDDESNVDIEDEKCCFDYYHSEEKEAVEHNKVEVTVNKSSEIDKDSECVDVVDTHNSFVEIDDDESNVDIEGEECCFDYYQSEEKEAVEHDKVEVTVNTPSEIDKDSECVDVVDTHNSFVEIDDDESNVDIEDEECCFDYYHSEEKKAVEHNKVEVTVNTPSEIDKDSECVDVVDTHNSFVEIDDDESNVDIEDEECCFDYYHSEEKEAVEHNKEEVTVNTSSEIDKDSENAHEDSNTKKVGQIISDDVSQDKTMDPPVKKRRGLWTVHQLKAAMDAVQGGLLTQRAAAVQYSIPRTTLGLHLKSGKIDKQRTILTAEQESDLASSITKLASDGYPLTSETIRHQAFIFCEENNIPNNFNKNNKRAGQDWLKLFLKRHSYISKSKTTTGKRQGIEHKTEYPYSPGSFNCKLCCRTFGSKKSLIGHYRMLHQKKYEERYMCQRCDYSSKWSHSLWRHVTALHPRVRAQGVLHQVVSPVAREDRTSAHALAARLPVRGLAATLPVRGLTASVRVLAK